MISFRYHIVSIVSVFLALAIGVALGGGPLKGKVDNSLVDQVQTDRAVKTRSQAEVAGLRSSNGFTDKFAATVAPGLVGNMLRGRVVTSSYSDRATEPDVSALRSLVGLAGGSVGGTLLVGKQLVDAGQKQLVGRARPTAREPGPDVSIPRARGPTSGSGRWSRAPSGRTGEVGQRSTAPRRASWPG